jgi:hypothetical protein
MLKSLLSIAVASAALAGAAPALAQQVKPVCTDNSRECLTRTALIYIDGLSRHDASKIPFAPNVRCTEQNEVKVTDEATYRHEINIGEIIKGSRNVRLLVDPQTQSVGAFYVLDINADKGATAYSVYRGQRFKIVGGYVTEVEVYNFVDPKLKDLGPPLWPDAPA